MATMIVHTFPTYAHLNQRRYMQRYLKKPPDMKVWSFTTRLIQLNTYSLYFPPDHPGQLVTYFHDDNIKEILYHAMPNTWEKKMVKQGYNYLDGPIFFETRTENLEKSIPPSVPTRNNRKSKKGSMEKKLVTFDDADDEDSDEGHLGKKFCHYHYACGHTKDQCTTLKALVKLAKQKKSKHFDKMKRFTKHEINVMVQKQVKKALKQEKRKHTGEVWAFKKTSVSDSDQKSKNSSSNKEGKRKLGSDELFSFNNNHSSKKLKKHTETFLLFS